MSKGDEVLVALLRDDLGALSRHVQKMAQCARDVLALVHAATQPRDGEDALVGRRVRVRQLARMEHEELVSREAAGLAEAVCIWGKRARVRDASPPPLPRSQQRWRVLGDPCA